MYLFVILPYTAIKIKSNKAKKVWCKRSPKKLTRYVYVQKVLLFIWFPWVWHIWIWYGPMGGHISPPPPYNYNSGGIFQDNVTDVCWSTGMWCEPTLVMLCDVNLILVVVILVVVILMQKVHCEACYMQSHRLMLSAAPFFSTYNAFTHGENMN